MFRRHMPLLVAIALVMLVVTACVVRTGPSRGRSYRSAPQSDNHKHKKWKEPKPKKHKKH